MKTIQAQRLDYRPDPIEIGHINLVVAIIKQAVAEEGIGYLKSSDGIKWLKALGLNPKEVLTKL